MLLLRLRVGEDNEISALNFKADLNGLAADFAIFNVGLMAFNRTIKQHADFFAAIGAAKELFDFTFHGREPLCAYSNSDDCAALLQVDQTSFEKLWQFRLSCRYVHDASE